MTDLRTMTLDELKAFAYDCIAALEKVQANLKATNDEIHSREAAPTTTKTDAVGSVNPAIPKAKK